MMIPHPASSNMKAMHTLLTSFYRGNLYFFLTRLRDMIDKSWAQHGEGETADNEPVPYHHVDAVRWNFEGAMSKTHDVIEAELSAKPKYDEASTMLVIAGGVALSLPPFLKDVAFAARQLIEYSVYVLANRTSETEDRLLILKAIDHSLGNVGSMTPAIGGH